MKLSKRAASNYKVKYEWDFRKVYEVEPAMTSWFNHYIMENGQPLPGEDALGELFDLDELEYTKEEAEHVVRELTRLEIPAVMYVDEKTPMDLANVGDKLDQEGKFQEADAIDKMLVEMSNKENK